MSEVHAKILSHIVDHTHNSPDNEDLDGFTESLKPAIEQLKISGANEALTTG